MTTTEASDHRPSRSWGSSVEERKRAEHRVRVLDGADIAQSVAHRVVAHTLSTAASGHRARLDEIAYETIYAEQTRLSHAAPDPRTTADQEFLTWLRRELTHANRERQGELVSAIVGRYVSEISGHFDPRVYGIATRVVPYTVGALLRGFGHGKLLGDPRLFDVDDRIVVDGEISALRELARIGTVVLAPTHASNLDSVVLGSAIYRQGLPPFAYGAGLNLFSSGTIGFFMRNLGAYTVDRKKTDPLYRHTLKEYLTVLLERGQHNLFFAGGTRSRSGALETRLKLGLLGTAPVAFRRTIAANAPRAGLFVVPCTITYPLVLEASSLVEDFLRAEGGSHYIDVRDEFERPKRWLDFLGGLTKLDHRVYVTIGRALDVVGNDVDERGVSHDPRGRMVDARQYFMVNGRLEEDDARDAAYTRLLASRLLASYRRDNLVLPTSVTAFAVLALLRRERREPDPFRFLRSVLPDASVSVAAACEELSRALHEVRELAAASRIRIPDTLRAASPEDVLDEALATFATYHAAPVLERRGDRIFVGDANLTFYYGNRLSGYALMGEPDFLPQRQHDGG